MQIIVIIDYFMFIMLIINVLIFLKKKVQSAEYGFFLCISENERAVERGYCNVMDLLKSLGRPLMPDKNIGPFHALYQPMAPN
jgi:hypothetical protein